MEIERVSYRKLESSLNNYSNQAIEATALVKETETPAEVLAALKQWVLEQLQVEVQIEAQNDRIRELDDQCDMLERRLEGLRDVWDKTLAFLQQHGVNTDTNRFNLPF